MARSQTSSVAKNENLSARPLPLPLARISDEELWLSFFLLAKDRNHAEKVYRGL